jgi:hypothetical protein
MKRSGFKRKPDGQGLKRDPEKGLKRSELKSGDGYQGLRPNPDRVREWMRKSATTSRANRREPTPREVVEEARMRSRGRCVVCGAAEKPGWLHHPHHVFPVRATLISFPELEKVADNVILLCPGCHDNHERAHIRVPRSKLPAATIALAEGHPERVRYLEDTYPL